MGWESLMLSGLPSRWKKSYKHTLNSRRCSQNNLKGKEPTPMILQGRQGPRIVMYVDKRAKAKHRAIQLIVKTQRIS